MSSAKAQCLSFLVTRIGVLLLLTLSLEVDAQSTVDDDESCQSLGSHLEETVKLHIRNNAKDIKQIKEQLAEVINVLGSLQELYNVLNSSKAGRFKLIRFWFAFDPTN